MQITTEHLTRQRRENLRPNEIRRVARVILSSNEDGKADGRQVRSEMVRIAEELFRARNPEHVREVNAVEHRDEVPAHRSAEASGCISSSQSLLRAATLPKGACRLDRSHPCLMAARRDANECHTRCCVHPVEGR